MEGVDVEQAMDAVIEDMGNAAHRFKRDAMMKKLQPKPAPTAEPTSEQQPDELAGPSLQELEQLIGG